MEVHLTEVRMEYRNFNFVLQYWILEFLDNKIENVTVVANA